MPGFVYGLFKILVLIMHMCRDLYTWMQVPLEVRRSLRAVVTSSCELSDMGVRKRTWVLCKNSMYSLLLCLLCSHWNTRLCVYCALNMHSTTLPHQQPTEVTRNYLCPLQLSKVQDSEDHTGIYLTLSLRHGCCYEKHLSNIYGYGFDLKCRQ